MRVSIKCHTNANHPGTVYATVTCAEETLIGATLDYCLSACAERGYTIENGHDVLMWLYNNASFVAYE